MLPRRFSNNGEWMIPERFLPTNDDLWDVGVAIVEHIDRTKSLDIGWLVRLLGDVVPTRDEGSH